MRFVMPVDYEHGDLVSKEDSEKLLKEFKLIKDDEEYNKMSKYNPHGGGVKRGRKRYRPSTFYIPEKIVNMFDKCCEDNKDVTKRQLIMNMLDEYIDKRKDNPDQTPPGKKKPINKTNKSITFNFSESSGNKFHNYFLSQKPMTKREIIIDTILEYRCKH